MSSQVVQEKVGIAKWYGSFRAMKMRDRLIVLGYVLALAMAVVVLLAGLAQPQNASSAIVTVRALGVQDYAKCVNISNPAIYTQIYDPIFSELAYRFEGDMEACDPATGQIVTITRDNKINGVTASFSSGAVVMLAVDVQDVGVVVVKEREISVVLQVP